jgi:2-dehydro-3-deoxygalactonokinase
MTAATFIAGDWGTSNLRLFLCDAQGVAQEQRNGPGAAQADGRFADVFSTLTSQWTERHGPLPAVLCGMVGSTIGWTLAPYVPCPTEPQQIADACIRLDAGRISIIPGLSCRNRFHAPDVMRGEETQILGVSRLHEKLRRGRWIVCLPGTHAKWVLLEDGRVRDFFTALTGELFAVLRDHSILVRGPQGTDPAAEAEAFERGVADVAGFPDAQILHRLFECRSRQLHGEFPAHAATAYLSGMLVASDVHNALRALSDPTTERTVVLVGAPQLTRRYATACARAQYDVCEVDGGEAVLAGLTEVFGRLTSQEPSS